ncbi:putative membrane-anchored protein [Aeromicrobium panaciterrae]|uniref:Membrane-anchored protein n=1 Tax=Aeromicrobium panaciterrae TaxID=363861 RepID=A0ABU1UNQ5_9ACTN|nr:putative cytokinetic ring protein SteA [Aeromicrobium panaciterrae]MDR7086806.1 putative membrane-anchored protein [Aeromicrobium panaciterrae]
MAAWFAMAIRNRKTPLPPEAKGIVGTVRFARRDKDLAALREGDIAVVDHPDLDSQQAEVLIDRRVRAVVNTSRSSSGRIPNVGPQMLAHAGITLVDVSQIDLSLRLKTGDTVRIEAGKIFKDEILVASGAELDQQRTSTDLASAESGLATKLDSLAANASDHIQREHAMLIGGARIPRLRTRLRRRPVVVVSRGHDDVADLRGLRRYIRDSDPVLIGAGAGADLLLDSGYTPKIVIGALDNLSDRAIRAAGEVVVTTASGRVEMPERLEKHGKQVATFVSTGADDDLAILLADTNEASVIIHVGAPADLSQFLDRAPTEAARMFVSRLRAGSKIVDAKAVHHFSNDRMPLWPITLLLFAGLAAVITAVGVTPVGQDWFDSIGSQLGDLGTWIKGLVS